MRVTVVGVERLEGTGKESKKPFSIGKVFATVKLETSHSDQGLTKGAMGTEYRVDVELVKRIEHLDFPVDAELTVEDVMRFGKRETKVLDVRPIARSAAPVQQLPKAA
ncbi:hypothetical protein QFZ83_003064 [Variovorax sp. W1I1]|uniref:hypothetical protein n=1 Tax=Variovorax sp. W1I1 TaxID=3042309 RepID=UPI00277F5036|nr:hypothetical protein [Variovorax sp. W1I1]MDQ0608893.1 hypothetical protein [Variovorax sp. W1I1]